jgi:hypothetical protein
LDRTHHRAELDQHAVAGGLDDPPAMPGDERIGGGTMLAQHPRRAGLVLSHQPAVAGNVGGEDRGQFAFDRLSRHVRLLPAAAV